METWNLLIGAAFGVIGTLIVQLIGRRESYRLGAYTERAKAAQMLLRHAREIKVMAVGIPGLKGPHFDQAARNLEAQKTELLNVAFDNNLWISERGVDAVRGFNAEIDASRLRELPSREKAEIAVEKPFQGLHASLLKDFGFKPK